MDTDDTHRGITDGDAGAHLRANRDLWDGWTELHVSSEFYDVEGFRAGREPLDAVELEAVGDVQGTSLLHLQCRFGLNTLSWARRGARATGVDFSEKAVAHARRLARELDLEARFICAEVTDTAAVLDELDGAQFDVVFTSVAGSLKPGGTFFLADSHPFTWMLDDETTEPELRFRFRFSYFDRAALRWEEKGSYPVPDGDFEVSPNPGNERSRRSSARSPRQASPSPLSGNIPISSGNGSRGW